MTKMEKLTKRKVIAENSCRLCLKMCGQKDQNSVKYIEQYKLCTGYDVNPEDIPKKICGLCVSELKRMISFQNKCRRTEERLIEHFNLVDDVYEEIPIKLELNTDENNQESSSHFTQSRENCLELNQVLIKSEDDTKFLVETTTSSDEKKQKGGVFCDQCGSIFSDAAAFKNHYKHHFKNISALPKLICDICLHKTKQKIGFESKKKLLDHMKRHHLRAKRQRPCVHCGRLFNNPNTLSSHVFRQHTDPKDYKYECLICHKRFFKLHLLKVHHRGHTGEKLYTCPICSAKFSMPQHMRIHIANIHNPTSHKCKICAKEFTSLKYLTQHMMIHNQGSYQCPLCPEKAFSLTTTLRSHMKTNHPAFPLPAPGTKLKNYDWTKVMHSETQIVMTSQHHVGAFEDVM